MNLGGGVAYRIVSPDLDAIRNELAEVFHGSLTVQDAGGWRPHVTIQNKVATKVARALLEDLQRGIRAAVRVNFRARPAPLSGRSLGTDRCLSVPGTLAHCSDAVAAEVERGQAGFEHRREHRLFQQLLDRSVRSVPYERRRLVIASSQSAAS